MILTLLFFIGPLFWLSIHQFLVKILRDYTIACHGISIIQSLLTCSVGLTTLLSIKNNSLDLITPNNTTSQFLNMYCAFQTSYFWLDIYFMASKIKSTKTRQNKNPGCQKPETTIILHHIFMGLLLPPVTLRLRSNKGDFFVACFMMFEASAPFTNFRAILSHVGRKSSKMYLVNGFLMLVTFFASRIYSPYAFGFKKSSFTEK